METKQLKCGLCGKKHNYYIDTSDLDIKENKLPSAVCKKCMKEINEKIIGEVNKIIRKRK